MAENLVTLFVQRKLSDTRKYKVRRPKRHTTKQVPRPPLPIRSEQIGPRFERKILSCMDFMSLYAVCSRMQKHSEMLFGHGWLPVPGSTFRGAGLVRVTVQLHGRHLCLVRRNKSRTHAPGHAGVSNCSVFFLFITVKVVFVRQVTWYYTLGPRNPPIALLMCENPHAAPRAQPIRYLKVQFCENVLQKEIWFFEIVVWKYDFL